MKKILLYPIGLPAMVLVLMFLSLLQAYADEVLPVLERPAMISPQSTQSVLLDITTAGLRLIAVGERGIILVSSDNGATWQQKPTPVSVTLTAVAFPSPLVGWAAGHSGVVLKSENGGETWRKQLDGIQAANLAIAAVQARKPTEEGMETFKRDQAEADMLLADGPDKPFLSLCFTDDRSGFVVGAYNLMFHTTDGGQTWVPWMNHGGNPQVLHFYRMLNVADDYYLAGERGLLLRSSDQGQTFQVLPSPYEGSLFGIISLENGILIAYGLRGHAFQSSDQGATWTPLDTGAQTSINDAIELKDGRLLLVTQSGQVLISNDHINSFSNIAMKTSFPFTAAAQAVNGDLVLVGARGVHVVADDQLRHFADKSGDSK